MYKRQGDGGACFTDDEALATRLREIRNHGQDRAYHHPRIGINGRMDTIQSTIILSKMTLFPDEVQKRSQLGARYSELLAEANCVTPLIAAENLSVYAQYTLQVENRQAVRDALQTEGIPSAVYYPITLDQQPALRDKARISGNLDTAHTMQDKVMSLPMHPYLEEVQMQQITDCVRQTTCQAD